MKKVKTKKKRLISMSLYGRKVKHTAGILANAKLVKSLLPCWTVRIYVEDQHSLIPYLLQEGAEVVQRPRSGDSRGKFWRFEPMYDRTVERFIVRDADTRLLQRDVVTICAWEQSGKPFVLWRDHPVYHKHPIIGGAWGSCVDNDAVSKEFQRRMAAWLSARHRIEPDSDKEFLKECFDFLTGGRPNHERMITFAFNEARFIGAYPPVSKEEYNSLPGELRSEDLSCAASKDFSRILSFVVNPSHLHSRYERFVESANTSRLLRGIGVRRWLASPVSRHYAPSWFNKSLPHFWAVTRDHIEIMANCLQSPFDIYLIFEDDAKIMPDFDEVLDEVMAKLPPDWDLLKLGANQEGMIEPRIDGRLYSCHGARGQHAILWSRAGMLKFYEYAWKHSGDPDGVIDHMWQRWVQTEKPNAFSVYPYPVGLQKTAQKSGCDLSYGPP